jgi:hypothetical protein
VVARLERATADAQFARRREAPAVTGPHVAAIDPDLEIVAPAVLMHLETPRQTGRRRLDRGSVRKHAAPAERVDDKRRAQLSAVGVDHVYATGVDPLDGRGLELARRRPVAQQLA